MTSPVLLGNPYAPSLRNYTPQYEQPSCIRQTFALLGSFFHSVLTSNLILFSAAVLTYVYLGWQIAAITIASLVLVRGVIYLATPAQEEQPATLQGLPRTQPINRPRPNQFFNWPARPRQPVSVAGSIPARTAAEHLPIISKILERTNDDVSAETLPYDIDRLFEEMAQEGLQNRAKFQARWNRLYGAVLAMDPRQREKYLPEVQKLVALHSILSASEEQLKGPDFAAFQVVQSAYEVQRKETVSLQSLTLSSHIQTANTHPSQVNAAFLNKAKTVFARGGALPITPPPARSAETQQLDNAERFALEYLEQGYDLDTAMNMAVSRVLTPSNGATVLPHTVPDSRRAPVSPPLTFLSEQERQATELIQQYMIQGHTMDEAIRMAVERVIPVDTTPVRATTVPTPVRVVETPPLTENEQRALELTQQYIQQGYDEIVAINMAWEEIDGGRSRLLHTIPAEERVVRDSVRIPRDIRDVTRINGGASAAAQRLVFSDRAMTVSPPIPQLEQDVDINAIPLDELLVHYDRLFPADRRDELARADVEETLRFIKNELAADQHPSAEYTTGIQLGLRFLIEALRKPEIPDDRKVGAILAITSWLRDHGCRPRRYEDLYGQVDQLRNAGRTFSDRMISWNATDKEEIIKRCCLSTGVHSSVLVHHINKARRDIGTQWGLKQDPVSINDPYIGTYGTSRGADDYREYLQRNWSPAYMIQQTKERLSHNADNRRIFDEEVARLAALGQLPEDWAETFYEVDPITPTHRNPSYAGVAAVLRLNGFLQAAPAVSTAN